MQQNQDQNLKQKRDDVEVVDSALHEYVIQVGGYPGLRWVTQESDEDDGQALTSPETSGDFELASRFATETDVSAAVKDLAQRFPQSYFLLEQVSRNLRGEVGKHDWCVGEQCGDGFLVFVDDRPISYRPSPTLARELALDVIADLQADGDYRLNDKPQGFRPPKRKLGQKRPVCFGDLRNGEQFFDPDCGEYFVKLSGATALMLTAGACDEDEADAFKLTDTVERLNEEDLYELSDVVRSRILGQEDQNPKWMDNLIQFPRLIAEIMATQEIDMPALAESMDISVDELNELFDRANQAWEAAKHASIEPEEDNSLGM